MSVCCTWEDCTVYKTHTLILLSTLLELEVSWIICLVCIGSLSSHSTPHPFLSVVHHLSLKCNKKEHLKLPDKLGMNTESWEALLERHRHDNSAGWLWDAVSRPTALGCCEEITKLLSHSGITQTRIWFNQNNKNIAGLAQRQRDSWYKLIDQWKAWPVFHLIMELWMALGTFLNFI